MVLLPLTLLTIVICVLERTVVVFCLEFPVTAVTGNIWKHVSFILQVFRAIPSFSQSSWDTFSSNLFPPTVLYFLFTTTL
jgi:hypothetical protein